MGLGQVNGFPKNNHMLNLRVWIIERAGLRKEMGLAHPLRRAVVTGDNDQSAK